jgi:hypothetical protein
MLAVVLQELLQQLNGGPIGREAAAVEIFVDIASLHINHQLKSA